MPVSRTKGVIAAGHEETLRSAESILKNGGNAFDAVVAAHLTACVAEPVLSSLAGGGFLLAQTENGSQQLYDFFAHTPRRRRNQEEIDFFPISADFGETQQEFHIGMGAFATPGTVRGLFAIHRELCTLPMNRLTEPAIQLARKGVEMNHFQAYILDVVSPVYLAFPGARATYGSVRQPDKLVCEGEMLRLSGFADFLEALGREGEDLFYRGEIAQMVDRLSREEGGHVRLTDFLNYEVIRRNPLRIGYRGSRLAINPGPSSGGTLIAFALKLMEAADPEKRPFGSANHLLTLARAQHLTDAARLDAFRNGSEALDAEQMLAPEYVSKFSQQMKEHPRFSRGTTHISIMDNMGNTASLTTTNGEGCGHVIPGTGIMLNNMLGEEDLHPAGFSNWPEDRRITSMMAPAILNMPDRSVVALGSGGSNRLRTAILQVILNLTDNQMVLKDAVQRARLHCEKGFLSVEYGFEPGELKPVLAVYPEHKIWSRSNLFFGGTHSVRSGDDGFQGAGDPRRGGVARRVD